MRGVHWIHADPHRPHRHRLLRPGRDGRLLSNDVRVRGVPHRGQRGAGRPGGHAQDQRDLRRRRLLPPAAPAGPGGLHGRQVAGQERRRGPPHRLRHRRRRRRRRRHPRQGRPRPVRPAPHRIHGLAHHLPAPQGLPRRPHRTGHLRRAPPRRPGLTPSRPAAPSPAGSLVGVSAADPGRAPARGAAPGPGDHAPGTFRHAPPTSPCLTADREPPVEWPGRRGGRRGPSTRGCPDRLRTRRPGDRPGPRVNLTPFPGMAMFTSELTRLAGEPSRRRMGPRSAGLRPLRG
ncbi:protein of unknown function [Streptantibioticus cattleyicolor NRRL 8057 = DSM 46488]|nr:protein of unknown function [Streptantibioticus cattleyicolor NRRL 8057 = DSM 46488]